MIIIETTETWIEPSEVRRLFAEDRNRPKKIDSDLGLEVVDKPTIEEKYGIQLQSGNRFHDSLRNFFDRTGFLTEKQLGCFRD